VACPVKGRRDVRVGTERACQLRVEDAVRRAKFDRTGDGVIRYVKEQVEREQVLRQGDARHVEDHDSR